MTSTISPEYRKLVGWLYAERKFKKVSQTDLAISLGFKNASFISKIEQFQRKLNVSEYVQYCQMLQIDPHEGINILLSSK